jgi:hypothetical protein
VLPEACTGFSLRGEARKGVNQWAIFREILIEKLAELTNDAKWESEDIEEQNKWKCDDPPKCFKEFSHFRQSRLRWVGWFANRPAGNSPLDFMEAGLFWA